MIKPEHSIEEYDQLLDAAYVEYAAGDEDIPEAQLRQEFLVSGMWPELGWGVLMIAERALSEGDHDLLKACVERFVRHSHLAFSQREGYGTADLLFPALYSALLGREYIQTHFHCASPLAQGVYAPYVHAANLMVITECGTWTHREQALAAASSYLALKKPPAVDKAFVRFFLGLVEQDKVKVSQAFTEFFDGYLKSDWGRYKPWSKPVFREALRCFALTFMASVTPEDEIPVVWGAV